MRAPTRRLCAPHTATRRRADAPTTRLRPPPLGRIGKGAGVIYILLYGLYLARCVYDEYLLQAGGEQVVELSISPAE